MKFFKNVFGSKSKKNANYDANTLAEANGSPDMRLATAKEKEADIPVIKQEQVKKIPKKSDKAAQSKTAITDENTAVTTASTKKTDKETSTVTEKKAASTKKTSTTKSDAKVTDQAKATAKKPIEKVPEKKTEEAKKTAKATEASAKKTTDTASSKSSNAVKSTSKKAVKAPEQTEEITVSKSAKTGKFEIKKSKDGRFVFNLYASNSVIVATSQVYSSSTSAMNGIKSVIANAASSPIEDQTLKNVTTVPYPKWEIYLDKGDQYRFRLCASNGSCVCHSQGYTSKANCKKGIESIIKFANDAEITKAYLDKKEK